MQRRPPVDLEADEQQADDDEEEHLAALKAAEESARAEYTRLYRLKGFVLPDELEPQLAVARERVREATEAAVSAVVIL